MYFKVARGQIIHSSSEGLVPLHGLQPEFIDRVFPVLQPEDDRWNIAAYPDAEVWRKQRVIDAQLQVLANYPECQYRLATDDPLTRTVLSGFLATRLGEPLPDEGEKTSFARTEDDRAFIAFLEYRDRSWNIVAPLKVLHNPTFLEIALAQKQAQELAIKA